MKQGENGSLGLEGRRLRSRIRFAHPFRTGRDAAKSARTKTSEEQRDQR